MTPSYITSILEELEVREDAEDSPDPPAELAFTFASYSGPDPSAHLGIRFGGGYPDGSLNHGYLTARNGARFNPRVPLFLGRESDMEFNECAEECAGIFGPDSCASCDDKRDNGFFTNRFEMALGGAQMDALKAYYGNPNLWGNIALNSTPGNCGGALSLADCLGNVLLVMGSDNSKVDVLGAHGQAFPSSSDYGISAGSWGPFALQDHWSREHGDVRVAYKNLRTGGLPVLSYAVRVLRLELQEGYEGHDHMVEKENELFLRSRVDLLGPGSTGLSFAKRCPSSGHLKLEKGTSLEFPEGLSLAGEFFDDPKEVAVLYIELGVWEDDRDEGVDQFGVHSESYLVDNLLSNALAPARFAWKEIHTESSRIRRVTLEREVILQGWFGSDCDEGFHIGPGCRYGPSYPRQGQVKVRYQVQVTAQLSP